MSGKPRKARAKRKPVVRKRSAILDMVAETKADLAQADTGFWDEVWRRYAKNMARLVAWRKSL